MSEPADIREVISMRRSRCCNAPVRVDTGDGDFIGDTGAERMATAHYVCDRCGNPCDLAG